MQFVYPGSRFSTIFEVVFGLVPESSEVHRDSSGLFRELSVRSKTISCIRIHDSISVIRVDASVIYASGKIPWSSRDGDEVVLEVLVVATSKNLLEKCPRTPPNSPQEKIVLARVLATWKSSCPYHLLHVDETRLGRLISPR